MATDRRAMLGAIVLGVALSGVSVFGQGAGGEPAAPAAPATAPSVTAGGDVAAASAEQLKPDILWRNLLHYIGVANADAACSTAEALLEAVPDPVQIYTMSEQTVGSMTVLARGANLKGMSEVSAKLFKRISDGYKAQRTNTQRIREAIARLEKGPEAYARASQELVWSGEYAVPDLLRVLMDPNTKPALRSLVINVLPRIGKEAVRPLSEALQTKDPQLQEVLVNVLGKIEYPSALPRIKELLDRSDLLDRTRTAAAAAAVACAGGDKKVLDRTAASLFYEFSVKYYERAESLLPDMRMDTANVWFWREGLGLVNEQVAKPIFCDIYAMRMARLALEHDPKFYPAVSVWLSANLDRQAVLPAGEVDSLRQADQPGAAFYTLASSPKYVQEVLARAMKDQNTPVALGAVKALVETAGTTSLLAEQAEGTIPLIQALSYPDREVRFLAAVSLANARPDKPFSGYQMVMPTLATALRQESKKVAVLISTDAKQTNLMKDALRGQEYEVIETDSPVAAAVAVSKAGGVDVAVITASDPTSVIAALRGHPATAALPMIVWKSTTAQELARTDPRIIALASDPKAQSINVADMKLSLEESQKRAAGRALTPEESQAWAVKAADAVRTLGDAGNTTYDLMYVKPSLSVALGDARAPVRTACANALAVLNDAGAQQAIAGLANDESVEAAVRVSAYSALSESIRRFGKQLTAEQSAALLKVVTNKGNLQVREAAARALGALNLSSQDVVSLMLKTAGGE